MTCLSLSTLATGALATGLLVACTLTDASVTGDGGGAQPAPSTQPVTDASAATKDSASPGGALGFAASNLGGFLATVDLSKLVDIDITGTDKYVSLACGVQSDDGCAQGTVTQADGSSANVYFARSWKIEPTALLAANDKVPMIVVALQTISILGRLDATATNQSSLAGGYAPASPGPGAGGGAMVATATNVGTGSGGAGFCGAGGAGGLATSTSGAAGKTYGTGALVPLTGGSAGGSCGLAAGAGGGAIELVAGVSLDVGIQGIISVGGGSGDNGDTRYAACGGGSGGAILLEAPAVTVEGILEANGGAGGGGIHANDAVTDATPNGTAASGGQPGTTGAGGNGSAGATTAGGAGGKGDALGGDDGPGGGGGGAGWIRINTSSGGASLAAGATLSPAMGSGCVNQGTLAH